MHLSASYSEVTTNKQTTNQNPAEHCGQETATELHTYCCLTYIYKCKPHCTQPAPQASAFTALPYYDSKN